MSHPIRTLLATAALSLVLGSCAPAAVSDWDPKERLSRITVLDPSSSVTIYIMPYSGIRRQLGDVRLGDSREFTIEPEEVQYRLVADYGLGREVVSHVFSVVPGDVWTWHLTRNQLSFQGKWRR